MEQPVDYICNFCGEPLSRPDSLTRHKKRCKKRLEAINNEITNNGTMQNDGNIQNGNNNTINNLSINIQTLIVNAYPRIVVPYTTPFDMRTMNQREINRIFNSQKNPFEEYFELVHCNLARPLYQNMYYDNDKYDENVYINVFGVDGWIKKNGWDVMDHILNMGQQAILNYMRCTYQRLDSLEVNRICDIL